jgi:hypothetical protein
MADGIADAIHLLSYIEGRLKSANDKRDLLEAADYALSRARKAIEYDAYMSTMLNIAFDNRSFLQMLRLEDAQFEKAIADMLDRIALLKRQMSRNARIIAP